MFRGMDGWRIRGDYYSLDAYVDADDRCYDDDGDGVHCHDRCDCDCRVPGDGNSNLCDLLTFWALSVWKSNNQYLRWDEMRWR